MAMASDFHEQQQHSASNKKANGESQSSVTSDTVKAGTKVVMTHAQRQAFLKTSRLGELLGVAHLLPEVSEVMQEPEDYPKLKRLKGLLKGGKPGIDRSFSTDAEVTQHRN